METGLTTALARLCNTFADLMAENVKDLREARETRKKFEPITDAFAKTAPHVGKLISAGAEQLEQFVENGGLESIVEQINAQTPQDSHETQESKDNRIRRTCVVCHDDFLTDTKHQVCYNCSVKAELS